MEACSDEVVRHMVPICKLTYENVLIDAGECMFGLFTLDDAALVHLGTRNDIQNTRSSRPRLAQLL